MRVRPFGPPASPELRSSPQRPKSRPISDSVRGTRQRREDAARRTVPPTDHAIVVFGCAVEADGTPSPGLRSRLERALEEAKKNPTARVLVSGGAVASAINEAETMRDVLVAAGLPRRRVVLEPASRFTVENAELSAQMVKNMGATRVTLVTEAFHVPRSEALMKQALAAAGSSARLAVAEALDSKPVSAEGERKKTARDLSTQALLHQRIGVPREWLA